MLLLIFGSREAGRGPAPKRRTVSPVVFQMMSRGAKDIDQNVSLYGDTPIFFDIADGHKLQVRLLQKTPQIVGSSSADADAS